MSRLLLIALLLLPLTWSAAADAQQVLAAARAASRSYQYRLHSLTEQARGSDLDQALIAIRALTELQDPRVVDLLLGLVDRIDYETSRVCAAIRGLARMGAQEAVPMIAGMSLLEDEPEIRACAITALGLLKSLSNLHYIDLMDDRAQAYRAVGVLGLSHSDLPAPEAGPILSEALASDESRFVRRMAAIALGDLGDPSYGPQLVTALADGDVGVRRYAAISLRRLNYRAAIPHILLALEANRGTEELNKSLMHLTGQDFGFHPQATRVARNEAIERAFRWYAEHPATQ